MCVSACVHVFMPRLAQLCIPSKVLLFQPMLQLVREGAHQELARAFGARAFCALLCQGRHLIPSDSNGLSDPYCCIQPNDAPTPKLTTAIRATLAPRWGDSSLIPFPYKRSTKSVSIVVRAAWRSGSGVLPV